MPFTLTVLGSAAAGVPGPGNAGTGFLVRHEGTTLLLDAGNGILGNLAHEGGLDAVDAIVLTHLHADHVQELYPIALYMRLRRRMGSPPTPRFPLYGPPGIRTLLYRWFHLFTSDPDSFVEAFDIREYEPWIVIEIGDLRVQPCPVDHAGGNAFGLRVDAGSAGRLVFSGDSKRSALLTEAAGGADLFLCEATFPPGHPGLESSHHLSWDEAGLTAKEAGAKRLVLTHLRIGDDPEEAVRVAAQAFGGPVAWARPRETFPVKTDG